MNSRLPWLTLTVAVAAFAIHLLPGVADWLQYDRAAIGQGELWRLLTAHLAHFGGNHLVWDTAAFLTLGAAAERESRKQCATALGLSAVLIAPVLWLWQPGFQTYRGLSGLDSALFGLLAGSLLARGDRVPVVAGMLALFGFAAKCLFELATAQTVFASGAGYSPVPLAHLVGLAAGVTVALAPLANYSARRTTRSSACSPQHTRSPA